MYSFVIIIAKDDNKAVLDDTIIPAPRLIKLIVGLLFADPDPIKNLVKTSNTFFLSEILFMILVINFRTL